MSGIRFKNVMEFSKETQIRENKQQHVQINEILFDRIALFGNLDFFKLILNEYESIHIIFYRNRQYIGYYMISDMCERKRVIQR